MKNVVPCSFESLSTLCNARMQKISTALNMDDLTAAFADADQGITDELKPLLGSADLG